MYGKRQRRVGEPVLTKMTPNEVLFTYFHQMKGSRPNHHKFDKKGLIVATLLLITVMGFS